jgi:putative spermidine/putrescine transport system substrate-binding protein
MKEGHQSWNNIWMLTKGGQRARHGRRVLRADANVYLAVVRCAHAGRSRLRPADDRHRVADANQSDDFDAEHQEAIWQRLAQAGALRIKGNAWQNVFPKEIRAYQDWWAKVQAA